MSEEGKERRAVDVGEEVGTGWAAGGAAAGDGGSGVEEDGDEGVVFLSSSLMNCIMARSSDAVPRMVPMITPAFCKLAFSIVLKRVSSSRDAICG